MHPDLCRYTSTQFYQGQLSAHSSKEFQFLSTADLPGTGAWLIPVRHVKPVQECSEEIEVIKETFENFLSGTCRDKDGRSCPLRRYDIIFVAPYDAQINALSDVLPDILVGTVDRFQGQEAPVVLMSMTASSAEETSRGLD